MFNENELMWELSLFVLLILVELLTITVLSLFLWIENRIDGVMVSMLALGAVDRGCKSALSQDFNLIQHLWDEIHRRL
jgi:hypothetical protein